MADTRPNYSTPSAIRSVTSYPARRGFKQAVDPALDHVVGVEDAIDIHCHARGAAGCARRREAPRRAACRDTLQDDRGPEGSGGTVGGVRALESWCEEKGLTPVHVWAGSSVTQGFFRRSSRLGRPRC